MERIDTSRYQSSPIVKVVRKIDLPAPANTGTNITFPTLVVNDNNVHDFNTGRFNIPKAGVIQLVANLRLQTAGAGSFITTLYHFSGAGTLKAEEYLFQFEPTGATTQAFSAVFVTPVDVGDFMFLVGFNFGTSATYLGFPGCSASLFYLT